MMKKGSHSYFCQPSSMNKYSQIVPEEKKPKEAEPPSPYTAHGNGPDEYMGARSQYVYRKASVVLGNRCVDDL